MFIDDVMQVMLWEHLTNHHSKKTNYKNAENITDMLLSYQLKRYRIKEFRCYQ